MRALLEASLGGTVAVTGVFGSDLWPIHVDEGELGIAILNLCVNARDAMPQGGTITIAACNRPYIRELNLRGDFVELSVTDTGVGMSADTIARCMEPLHDEGHWQGIRIGTGAGLWLRAWIRRHGPDREQGG
jgi:signal transduction histidine kinase